MKIGSSFILKETFINNLSEAVEWYNSRSNHLGDELYRDVRIILGQIELHPESFSITIKKYRQAVLNRFPYLIVFKIYPNEIVVYSLFHTSRNPKRKLRRL